MDGEPVGSAVDLFDQRLDQHRPGLDGLLAKVTVEALAAHHADVAVRHVHEDGLALRRAYTHAGQLLFDQLVGNLELLDQAERDRASARLDVIELAFDEDGRMACLGENLGGDSSRRPSSYDCDIVQHFFDLLVR